MTTIQDRVAAARARLRAAGIPPDEADRDARLLARTVLGWEASRFWTEANASEPEHFTERFEAVIARRAAREPVAYIRGRQEFWGLDFEVSRAVLIPRPETELIIEAVLELCPTRDLAFDLADVGTGSGCLAVSLAHELPNLRVVATDVSDDALDVARRNAARHGVLPRIELRRADLLAGVAGPFHLIVANPPYVGERERPALKPEVRDNEPAIALFGGEAGLSVIPRLLDAAVLQLRSGGVLVFEFGLGQLDAVCEMIQARPDLGEPDVREDLQGIPRIILVQHG